MIHNHFTLSVVLCTYNGEKYIRKQLESVIMQSYKVNEVIILDDCSKDSTEAIVLEYVNLYPNIKVYKNTINLGPIASFQKAVQYTNSDYIAFCDQDDIWEKDKLERQIKILTDNSIDQNVPVLLFHDLSLMDINDVKTAESFWKVRNISKSDFSFDSILFSNIVTGCTCIINKKMKESFQKVNIKNIIMHDHWFALVAFGFGKAFYSNDCMIRYRSHSNSVTAKEKTGILERIRNIFKNFFDLKDQYLIENIRQAEELKLLYFDQVEGENKTILNKMIMLKNKSFFMRIFRPYFRLKKIFK